jgi:hypothetical protein
MKITDYALSGYPLDTDEWVDIYFEYLEIDGTEATEDQYDEYNEDSELIMNILLETESR